MNNHHSASMAEAPFDSYLAEGPDTVNAHWVYAADGLRLRIAIWTPSVKTRGTVLVFQGRTENIEKYGRAADVFVDHGYTVMAIDWRGQGSSDRLSENRRLGHVEKFADYQKDVAAMISAARAFDLPKPYFLLGHSLGAAIGLRALAEGLPITACAFTAPLWGIRLSSGQRLAAWTVSWLAKLIGKAEMFAPGTGNEAYVLQTPFQNYRLTHDPDMYAYYIRISEGLVDHQIGGPSMGWLFEALKEMVALSKLRPPKVACIAFCGEQDSLVDVQAASERVASWPRAELQIVPKGRHDVLFETTATRRLVYDRILEMFDRY